MIVLKVDGKVEFRGELDEWVSKAPDELRDAIKPGAKPLPWMKAVLITFAELAVTRADARITVKTHPDGWEMRVKQ